ncbi:unnamed protein product [Adineta ricciae]|uniref:G-protein coupled receptors family 1 profile domain-containing protein n=1 Tax=Adineta ricciae TaxID=249248 RepID=A0A815QFV6_ADIRI|nr:unnamed protein product [Adineta ricciae]
MMLIMYAYNLQGNLDPFISFGGRWCQIRTYLAHVCLCALYYSFVLQAIFRLFRIKFYRYRVLQSFGVFCIAVFLQWLISFLWILPNLLLGDFQYLLMEYNCWISFEDVRGLLILIVIIYGVSTSMISSIYMFIIRYVHRTSNVQQHQRRQSSDKRDLLILKRLVILVTVVVTLGFPTVLVIFVYVFTGYVLPLAYHVQGVSLSVGAFVTSVSLIFITPQLLEIFQKKSQQIRPAMTMAIIVNRPCTIQTM